MKIFLVALLVMAFFITEAQTIQIKIIETTDVHGKILPYAAQNQNNDLSLANVYSYIKTLRENNEQIILLDNGDILQGDPSVYYYNFINDSVQHLCARIMNFMQYDAASVGNHDIETGHQVYDRVNEEYDFLWLAANAVKKDSGEPYFVPFTIIEKEGIRIAVLGMITPHIPNWLPETIWEGMYFEDMVIAAKKWMPIIQHENPDLIIGLFHAGVDYTYGNQNANTEKNENAVKLVAEQVDGFDIIFAGHDHKEWNFTVKSPNGKEVLILDAGSHAKNVAQAIVTFNKKDEKIEVSKIEGEIVAMKNFSPDSVFLETFANDGIAIRNFVNETIGIFTSQVVSNKSFFGDSEFMDLIHTAQLSISGADISFAAPLSFSSTIDSGEVIMADMFELYRFENLLYTMELSGNEIDAYLEYAYDLWLNKMESEDDFMLNLRKNEKNNQYSFVNQYYNFDSAEGIKYTVDLTKGNGERVEISGMTDGEDFFLEKKYKVAINSYRGNGGGGHLVKGAGISKDELPERIIVSTEKDLRYYMMQWIKKSKEVTPTCNRNWEFVPYDWYSVAAEREFKILFGK